MQTQLRLLIVGLVILLANSASAQLMISDIRQDSLFDQTIDTLGGIVTFKSTLGTRVILQDPTSDSYGAIQIRDRNSVQNDTGGWLWNRVEVGDWVSFTDVRVTE